MCPVQGGFEFWFLLELFFFFSVLFFLPRYVFRRLGLGRVREVATVLASEFLLPTEGVGLCRFFLKS